MKLTTARRLFLVSSKVAPGARIKNLHNKFRFLFAAWLRQDEIEAAFSAESGSNLARLLEERPETLGVLVWPYQASHWQAPERLDRIRTHCEIVDSLGAPFKFSIDEKLALLELDSAFPGLRVVLDQPRWFMREGQFTLNIFLDDFRAFSLVFSFFRGEDQAIEAVIGAVQGRNKEGILDTYRTLTKALYGLRPRDFLIETFRMLCRIVGVKRIYAVSNTRRVRYHPYFKKPDVVSLDYDEIWRDRGGSVVDSAFFELERNPAPRDLSSVKPNKRSMYRKRNRFLKDTEAALRERLPDIRPVCFKDR